MLFPHPAIGAMGGAQVYMVEGEQEEAITNQVNRIFDIFVHNVKT